MTQSIADVIKAREKMYREPLALYRPCTVAQYDIHTCDRPELIVPGGNRASKTFSTLMEFASRVMGVELQSGSREQIELIADAANLSANYEPLRRYLASPGRPLPLRYKVPQPSFPRLYWIVGVNLRHIGQRIYRFLFEPGLMKLIRDQRTKQWRVYNPADPVDASREHEMVAAEPLIPERFIVPDSWVWAKGQKNDNIFESVQLTNGATIRAYSSTSEPEQGDEIDGLLIDEDIKRADWLSEGQRRLLNRNGWFMWTVWPHRKNFALVKLQNRVKQGDPHIKSIQLRMSDNPFIDQETKDWSNAMAGSPDEVARRDHGDMLLDELSMYSVDDDRHGIGNPALGLSPEEGRQRYLHTMERKAREPGSAITRQQILAAFWNEYTSFPVEWTRYLAIDPSNTRTGVLFGVVPPPELFGVPMGRCVIIEHELVMRKASAKKLAKQIQGIVGNRVYEAFIMDKHEGRKNQTGRENTTFQHYSEAFKEARLSCRVCGSAFIPGCDVLAYRYRCVRSLLEGGSSPDMYYVRYSTPELQREFTNYRKTQIVDDSGELLVIDKPKNPEKYDLMATLEYMCAYLDGQFQAGTAYVPPGTYAPAVTEGNLADVAREMQELSLFGNQLV